MIAIVHAFVYSTIDYCNCLLIGLPKVRLSPTTSVLNVTARLIARLPKFFHISSFMFNQLHWLPLSARIEFKIVGCCSQISLVSHSLPFICNFTSTTQLLRLAGSFCSAIRTTMVQTRSFATIGPCLWNSLSSSLRITLLSESLSASFSLLKIYFLLSGTSDWGSATEWSLPWAALYKFRNTIRYEIDFTLMLIGFDTLRWKIEWSLWASELAERNSCWNNNIIHWLDTKQTKRLICFIYAPQNPVS